MKRMCFYVILIVLFISICNQKNNTNDFKDTIAEPLKNGDFSDVEYLYNGEIIMVPKNWTPLLKKKV